MRIDDISPARLFIIAASLAALLFVFVTPPFKVPDEVGHFWRAVSIAQGTIVPRVDRHGAVGEIPIGLKSLVYVFLWQPDPPPPQAKISRSQFRTAISALPLEGHRLVTVSFPAGYTPVAYAPQVLAALAGRLFGALPVITFYLGRLLNALAFIALISVAIRVTPVLPWAFCAAGLLPMALYLAASWSPDAMTMASAFLFLALLLRACLLPGRMRGGESAALAAAGALTGLTKPAYFLIALLVLVIPAARSQRRALIAAAVLLATAAGVAVSMWVASSNGSTGRSDVFVDPGQQLACIRHEPVRFARVVVNDFRLRGSEYTAQCVGRLGMLDVWLPRPIIWAELMALLVAAASSGGAVSWRIRVVAALACLGTMIGIALASYLGWTPPCSDLIDGIQGRYFLPIVPLMAVVVGFPAIRGRRVPLVVISFVALASMAAAVLAIVQRYYS